MCGIRSQQFRSHSLQGFLSLTARDFGAKMPRRCPRSAGAKKTMKSDKTRGSAVLAALIVLAVLALGVTAVAWPLYSSGSLYYWWAKKTHTLHLPPPTCGNFYYAYDGHCDVLREVLRDYDFTSDQRKDIVKWCQKGGMNTELTCAFLQEELHEAIQSASNVRTQQDLAQLEHNIAELEGRLKPYSHFHPNADTCMILRSIRLPNKQSVVDAEFRQG
jgi:DNA-binding transcriptional MerR regulator